MIEKIKALLRKMLEMKPIEAEPVIKSNDKDPYSQTRHFKAVYSLLIALLFFSILFLLGAAAKSLGLFPPEKPENPPSKYSAVTVKLECLKYKWPEYKFENTEECSTLIADAFDRAKLPTIEKLDALDKRIGDIGTIAQILGVGTGIFGILITVLVIYFSMNERERMEKIMQDNEKKIEKIASEANEKVSKAIEEGIKASNMAIEAREDVKKSHSDMRNEIDNFTKNLFGKNNNELMKKAHTLDNLVNLVNVVNLDKIGKSLSSNYIYENGRGAVMASVDGDELKVSIDGVYCVVDRFNDEPNKEKWGELIPAAKKLIMRYKIEDSDEIDSVVIINTPLKKAASDDMPPFVDKY